jgi:hypothetical protein
MEIYSTAEALAFCNLPRLPKLKHLTLSIPSHAIHAPFSNTRKYTYLSIRWGELNLPHLTPAARIMAEMYAHIVPLPLVPATWTACHVCGVFWKSFAARPIPRRIIRSNEESVA